MLNLKLKDFKHFHSNYMLLGWRNGNKNAPIWLRDYFLPRGFHVVGVGYRLAQHEKWPAQRFQKLRKTHNARTIYTRTQFSYEKPTRTKHCDNWGENKSSQLFFRRSTRFVCFWKSSKINVDVSITLTCLSICILPCKSFRSLPQRRLIRRCPLKTNFYFVQ